MGSLDGGRVLNIAHRGASSAAPPNTLSAVRKAYELGADGIEFDVRLSRDGVPVVIHDATIALPAGERVRVADLTLEGLKAIDVGSKFGPAHQGEQIPTLEELLTHARGRLLLNLELKSTAILDTRLARAAAAEVQRVGLGSEMLVSSFNPFALLQTKRVAPHIPLGLLGSRAFPRPPLLSLLGLLLTVKAVHPEHTTVDPLCVTRARRRGMRVHTWTVDDPAEMRRLIDLGVNGIITNVPDVLGELLQTTQERRGASAQRDQESATRPEAWFEDG